MPKFSVHVALMSPVFRPVSFSPGDDVPEWAEELVGEHCLEPEEAIDFDGESDEGPGPESEGPADDSETDETQSEEEPQPAVTDVPDFTAPAPARRGSRTRK